MTGLSADKAPIIEIKDVTFRYPGADQDSLSQVSLTVERGDFIAIIGSNGSGKSTLCKCLNGLIPAYYAGDMEGSVAINGMLTSRTSIAELSKQVAYVFQDFENQLVRPTVYDEVCFAPLNFGYENYKERGARALQMLEMEDIQGRWIWQLSGGQKHMTALAAALSLDPEIIIVDEPVAQLDPAHARMIYEKLTLLNRKYNKTIIVIEHHTEYIADYCQKVVLMEAGGKLRWMKNIQEGLSSVEELSSLHIQPPQVTQAFYELRAQLYGAKQPDIYPITIEEAAQSLQHASLPGVQSHQLETSMSASDSYTGIGKRLVHFDGVVSGYQSMDRNQKPTLQNINLEICEGERIALIGNNGAGKSTLLRLIAGIRRPWQGTVTVCGTDTRTASPENLSEHVSFIFQNPEEMFIADNIRSDIEFFLRARKRESIEPFVDHIVRTFKLEHLQQRDGRLLSGGQQRRATLAIGMAMRPSVMLLDEPTASLDIASRREMTQLFDELRDDVKAVVVATHDMQLVADWATRVIVMNAGTIVLDTNSRDVFEQKDILELAALIPPQIVSFSHRAGIAPACLSVPEFVGHIRKLQEVYSGAY